MEYLIGAAWVFGWLFCCGNHIKNIATIKKLGTSREKELIKGSRTIECMALFIFWPFYLLQ